MKEARLDHPPKRPVKAPSTGLGETCGNHCGRSSGFRL